MIRFSTLALYRKSNSEFRPESPLAQSAMDVDESSDGSYRPSDSEDSGDESDWDSSSSEEEYGDFAVDEDEINDFDDGSIAMDQARAEEAQRCQAADDILRRQRDAAEAAEALAASMLSMAVGGESCDDDDRMDGEDSDGFDDSDDSDSDASDVQGDPGTDEAPVETVKLKDLQISMEFVRLLREATLEGDFISKKLRHQMHNPIQGELKFTKSANKLLAIRLFRAVPMRDKYEAVCEAVRPLSPNIRLPSHYKVKRLVQKLTGVTSVATDMCVNSCLAYTGPYAEDESCAECGEPRYDQIKMKQTGGIKKDPRLQYHTIPIGPVIQAFWRSPTTAAALRYRRNRTAEIRAELERTGKSWPDVLDDYCCSSLYLDSVESKDIREGDTVLMFSIDGAQLYSHKSSDVWIWIWVLLDLPPELRYKKEYVIPAAMIPGPHKPKHLDSFLFIGLYHLAALQKDGLNIWDSIDNEVFRSDPGYSSGLPMDPELLRLTDLFRTTESTLR